MTVQLRPAQAAILAYENGRLAVSAVPGSGKTFTLSLLAAQLIENGRITTSDGQQVLIVTFLNTSVDTFKARIRRRLEERGLPPAGYDVRTLHSLAHEIVRLANSSLGEENDGLAVLSDTQASQFLGTAVDQWIETHPDRWGAFLSDDSPQMKARWRSITESTAQAFIRSAKNERYTPDQITAKLAASSEDFPLLSMMAEIYGRYQTILVRQAAFDFDDLIWQAADLLIHRPDLTHELRQRWPYVLEDEAQDSVPLQELLLSELTGPQGNWVRVGDPNQAITSTFTAAHPRFFNAFNDRDDVVSLPLPNSGRSAPLIIDAANTLLNWVIDHHPVPEVRVATFRRQNILPTPAGDAQPNPPNSEATIRIKVFRHREDEEVPGIAKRATDYARKNPEQTIAILVPTNQVGHLLVDHLDELDATYDNLLRGGSREREIAAAIHAILAILADPLSTKAIESAYASLHALGHPAATAPDEDVERIQRLLKSVHRPEALLFPWDEADVAAALPTGIATAEDLTHINRFLAFLRPIFDLRPLPIDDLALALSDQLFSFDDSHEADLALAFQIAIILRSWRETQPELRLPDLVANLADVVAGRRRLPLSRPAELGYEPEPGRITLTTQHSSKGLEWDVVFLLGIDGFWMPSTLDSLFLGVHDFLGGDPTAEVVAQLRYLMEGDVPFYNGGLYNGRSATESSHIDVISERLRLFYVSITRARRKLYISRSRATRQRDREREAEPATVMGVLYRFLKEREKDSR